MRRPQTARALRELDREARHNAVILPEDEDLLGETGAWRNMDQSKLPLREQPIKGATQFDADGQVRAGNGGADSHTAASIQNQEETVAAAPNSNLPSLPSAIEPRARILAVNLETRSAEIADKLQALQERRKRASGVVTRQLVAEAQELDSDGKKFVEEVEKSDLNRDRETFHRWHKIVTTIIGKVIKPADDAHKFFDDCNFSFNQAEKRRVAEENRKRDEAVRRQQEEERAAQIAAEEAAGHVEEVELIKATPIPDVVSTMPRATGKLEGTSLIYSAKLHAIKDPAAFTKWLAEHPEHVAGFDIRLSYWKTILTNHLSKDAEVFKQMQGNAILLAGDSGVLSISIPGVEVEITGSSRNRSNGE